MPSKARVPRVIRARERASTNEARFFQSVSLPEGWVRTITEGPVPHEHAVRPYTQWRLDCPPAAPRAILPAWRTVYTIAETLLTRGTVPYCTPSLDSELVGLVAEPPSAAALGDALQHVVACGESLADVPLDSREERVAFRAIDQVARTHGWSIIPQLELASLSDHFLETDARVDFLASHPSGDSFVLEIDGEQHRGHAPADTARDQAIRRAGIGVVRVSASAARTGGPEFARVIDRLSLPASTSVEPLVRFLPHALRWAKLAHQVQLAVIQACLDGWIAEGATVQITVVPPARLLKSPNTNRRIMQAAITDVQALLHAVAHLYRLPEAGPAFELVDQGHMSRGGGLLIDASNQVGASPAIHPSQSAYLVADVVLPTDVAIPLRSVVPSYVSDPDQRAGEWLLNYLFRKPEFREGQWQAVSRTLAGKDSVVLLPTGAGKSITFQLAALLMPGRCIVVDPILALIDDQIENLRRAGIDRCIGISGELTTAERDAAQKLFSTGYPIFCYVSPERFQIQAFRGALRALTEQIPLSLVAVDEAHCVSEWGHDFRPAYLNLGRIAREYGAHGGHPPPVLALTGTASKIVLKDVQRELAIQEFDSVITPRSFDRKELHFGILMCQSSRKSEAIGEIFKELPTKFSYSTFAEFAALSGMGTQAGIVFCPHVDGPYGIVQLRDIIEQSLSVPVVMHGGKPKGWTGEPWQQLRRLSAEKFKKDEASVLIATKGFGMGIDKSNIRYTIHLTLPPSIEAFYQEAGRSGRDRSTAQCWIIVSNDRREENITILDADTSIDTVISRVKETKPWQADDIDRQLFFHTGSFNGIDVDIQDINDIFTQMTDDYFAHSASISWKANARWQRSSDPQKRAERAIHRLVIMGVASDYTINHAAHEIEVRLTGISRGGIIEALRSYVASYQQPLGERVAARARALPPTNHVTFILSAARLLLEHIYNQIEKQRRRALLEMLQAAEASHRGEDFRKRIIDYLSHSVFDQDLESVIDAPNGGMNLLGPILDKLYTPGDAESLRGVVARNLESYPENPALLLLRAVAERLSPQPDIELADRTLRASLQFARDRYNVPEAELVAAIAGSAQSVELRPGGADAWLSIVLQSTWASRPFVRLITVALPPSIASVPAAWLSEQLVLRSRSMRTMEVG